MHGVVQVSEFTAPPFIPFSIGCDWIALFALPGSERKACVWLRRRQFKPYWPRYQSQIKLNRHRRAIRWRSVIPGYLFLPITRDQDRNWNLIRQAPGIHGRMNDGEGGPKFLTDQHIADIQRIEAALTASEICAVQGIPFKVGQKVKPRDDLFYQWEGKIVRIDNRRSLAVEVPGLFGATAIVMFAADQLEAV